MTDADPAESRAGTPEAGHAPERESGPSPPDAGEVQPALCDLCGGPALERHCKSVCRVCGYTRDCSDP